MPAERNCAECYAPSPRATPLLRPLECLQRHTQYICGTCGRCVCIERDENRGLQRWHFPFSSLAQAVLYLRAADYTMKKACGIYAISQANGRVSYKIFPDREALEAFLRKHPGKTCTGGAPVFSAGAYREFPGTQARRLTGEEARAYLAQR